MRVKRTVALFTGLMVLGFAACADTDEDGVADDAADGPATEEPTAQPGQEAPSVDAADLPEGVTAEMVSQGQEIFTGAGLCFTCHTESAEGGPLAPDLTDDEWLNISGRDYDEIVEVVNTGVPEPVEHPSAMPPMGGASLTEEQVRSVAAYVYALGESE